MGMTPLQYLRFDAGRYGRARLAELARWQTGPHADRIRELAQEALAQKVLWGAVPASDIPAVVAKLRIFPAGRTLDQDLMQELIADLRSPAHGFAYQHFAGDGAAGVFVDLNGDKIDEFVFLASHRGLVYEKRGGRWVFAADIACQCAPGKLDLIGELTRGSLAVTTPKWNELTLGGFRFRMNE